MSTIRVAPVANLLAAVLAFGAPAFAQNEAALKSSFEGHRVTVRIDMPGSADGVDVRDKAMDLNRYRNDLKRYGTSIHAGESAMVTLVKVKKDLIEFQLDGGGFGTFGDDTSTNVNIPLAEKTDREKTLEKELKDEKNPDRRRMLQSELDRLRDRRESENRRIRVERERAEEIKKVRIADDRLRGGSRFNIKFNDRVPAGIHSEDVMAALVEFVDFRGAAPVQTAPAAPPAGSATSMRKGMLRIEAERLFGRASQSSQKAAGEFTVITLVFLAGEQRITADFIEDVLVRYAIASK